MTKGAYFPHPIEIPGLRNNEPATKNRESQDYENIKYKNSFVLDCKNSSEVVGYEIVNYVLRLYSFRYNTMHSL